MSTAVLGKKVRRNVPRKVDRRKPVKTGDVVGGVLSGLGRTLFTLTQWILGMAFVVAVSFAILVGYRWITAHEFFGLANLIIEGGKRLSPGEIAAMGGVGEGQNVLGLNIAEVQRRIAACEWVESVAVTRVLPDGLVIDVVEREPAFLVRRGEQLFYADVNGQTIAAVGVDKFISLPLLEKEDGVPAGPGIRVLLDEVSRNALPFGMSQIAWLRQDGPEQFSLFLEKPRVLVQLDGTDLHATLACLARLWADLEAREELERVGLMFVTPDRAWVRLNEEQTL